MPPWRSVFAWFALVPLLWAVPLRFAATPRPAASPLLRAFFIAYLCGFLWYMGNCYWVRDTMMHYGDMPPMAPTLLLIGFSLVLGLYFGLFGLGVALVRRATGSTRLALAFAPILWTAPGPGRRPHHQRSLGPARLLAGRQRTGEPACAVDGRLRHQFCSGRSERAARRRFAAGKRVKSRLAGRWAGRWVLGRLRSASADLRFLRRFCRAAQTRAHRHRRSHPAQSRRRLRQQLARAGMGQPYRRIHSSGRRAMQDATSPAFRRPARRRARSSARRILLIPISSSGRSRPRPSTSGPAV